MKGKNGFLLVLPAMLLILFILVIPLFYAFYCSLYNLDYLVKGPFQGLGNYRYLLNDPEITGSFIRTTVITILAAGVSLILGLALALWIDRHTGPFAYVIEMIGLVPWVISMVVGALLWRWIFTTDLGLIDLFYGKLTGKPAHVLSRVRPAQILLTSVLAWRTVGYSMIMILAGLKALSPDLIEAARIDGAGPWQILMRIKLPLIKTPMLVSSIVLTLSNFTNNTVPMVLTAGGPGSATNVITLHVYKMSFTYYQFGRSSALSILVFLVTLIMVVFYTKAVKYDI
ncbi:carbohydrate ABC transporter permease [Breznakiella homolactica]|uniref:Sugar ABC transporter permease n=1 Tax=Breznakiella homolactica TaxID=2798577 RepID=A0A7T8BB01_9SPIR|nr:sugar ABC transporter permease [Breznakiella homolactica]QQO08703.1 sugar ABC transporter permease [Breznakiella homolactica]